MNFLFENKIFNWLKTIDKLYLSTFGLSYKVHINFKIIIHFHLFWFTCPVGQVVKIL